jgi:actin-related protein 5
MPTEEDFQIKLGTDRYKGSEILFQPSIVGLECESLPEILENILFHYAKQNQKQKLLDFVLLSGGNTLVQGFDARVKQELVMLNPSQTPINVVRAFDAEIDAWRGGAQFCTEEIVGTGSLKEFSISKAQYEECGHHYLKEHACSNYLYG